MSYTFNPFTCNFDRIALSKFNWSTPQEIKILDTNYVLQSADAGFLLIVDSLTSITLSVPNNADSGFLVGQKVDVLQYNTGSVLFTAVDGVNLGATPGYRLREQYSAASFINYDIDDWVVVGDLDYD